MSIEEQQNELRKKRNEYSAKAQECQKVIDELEFSKYQAHELVGTYTKYGEDYIRVDGLRRLYNTIELVGPIIRFTDKAISMSEGFMMYVPWKAIPDLPRLTRDEVLNELAKRNNEFVSRF